MCIFLFRDGNFSFPHRVAPSPYKVLFGLGTVISFNATPNLGNWFNDLTTPGIFVGASKLLIAEHYNPVTALGTFAPSCNFTSSQPVVADGLTGSRDMWTCANSTTRFETVAMWPKDHSFIAYIQLKIVTAVDEADGNRVLSTLSIRY